MFLFDVREIFFHRIDTAKCFYHEFHVFTDEIKKCDFHDEVKFKILTLYCIMLKNGQTYFKNFAVFTPQDF